MKRIIGVLLSLGLTITSSTLTYAKNNQVYTYEELITKALAESIEVKEIELNEKLTKIQYDQDNKDYKYLKERVEKAKESVESYKTHIEAMETYYIDVGSRPDISAMMQFNAQHYTIAKSNYENLLKQEIKMIKPLENMMLIGRQASRKTEQGLEKTKVALQKDYYNILLLKEQKELLERNYNSLIEQIKIEELTEKLGMSTGLAVRSLKNQLDSFISTQNELENNMKLAVESLKTKLNMDKDEELKVDYKISHPVTYMTGTLNDHMKKFMENSLELETVRKNAEVQKEIFEKTKIVYKEDDDEYKIAEIELMQAELNEQKLEKNMEIAAKQIYFQYKKAEEQVLVQMENKKDIEKKIKQLDLQYENGLISSIQYEMQSTQYQQSLFEYNRSLVTFLNAKADLTLLTKGVMSSASR